MNQLKKTRSHLASVSYSLAKTKLSPERTEYFSKDQLKRGEIYTWFMFANLKRLICHQPLDPCRNPGRDCYPIARRYQRRAVVQVVTKFVGASCGCHILIGQIATDGSSGNIITQGSNNIPNPPNREGLPDVQKLGPQTTTQGGHFNLNLRVDFDKGDNLSDYMHVRAAIVLNSNEPIRNGSADENPDDSHQIVRGQSRFVTDVPGLRVSPRAALADKAVVMGFVAGEYNKKTQGLSSQVAYYALQISYDKNGAVDTGKNKDGTPKTWAVKITREQFLALMKTYKVKIPKKKKQDCPECLLSPPGALNPSR